MSMSKELRAYSNLSSALKMAVPQGTRGIPCPLGCGQTVIFAPDGVTPLEVDVRRKLQNGRLAMKPHLPHCRAHRSDRRRR